MAQKSKTKNFYYWRKFQVFTYFSTFGEFYLVKLQKSWKKSMLGSVGEGSINKIWKYVSNVILIHWQNLRQHSPTLIFVPNPFRVFISTYESFNFCIKLAKVGFCLFPPAGPLCVQFWDFHSDHHTHLKCSSRYFSSLGMLIAEFWLVIDFSKIWQGDV